MNVWRCGHQRGSRGPDVFSEKGKWLKDTTVPPSPMTLVSLQNHTLGKQCIRWGLGIGSGWYVDLYARKKKPRTTRKRNQRTSKYKTAPWLFVKAQVQQQFYVVAKWTRKLTLPGD